MSTIIDEFVKLEYNCPLAILLGLQAGMHVMLPQLQLKHDLVNTTGATSKECIISIKPPTHQPAY